MSVYSTSRLYRFGVSQTAHTVLITTISTGQVTIGWQGGKLRGMCREPAIYRTVVKLGGDPEAVWGVRISLVVENG